MAAKIKKFTKANVSTFHSELAEVLEKLAKKHGLSVKKSAITYGELTVTKKLEFFVPTSSEPGAELVSPKFVEAFKYNCELVGLKKTDLNKIFTHNGTDYKVAGINVRKKNSIVLVNLTKNCLAACNESFVKRMIH
jgi:hypothetical protein